MESAIIILLIILVLVDISEGDPRSQVIEMRCSQQVGYNQTRFIPNIVRTMENIGAQIRASQRGTAVTGTGPDSSYGLAECYGDLSAEDCILCYAEARTVLPACLPNTGGQIFLDGCFMRMGNYSFFKDYAGPNDTMICGNTSRYGVSLDQARQAISAAARDAPSNRGYFARKGALSGATNESTYVLADCWGTLNESSCTKCLKSASASILQCLPWSEGRALHTGCFMRYSNTNFLNGAPTGGDNGAGDAKSKVIQRNCQNQQVNNGTQFTQNFYQAMADMSTKMRTSQFGTVVSGTEPDRTYGLAQCYGDLSTSECNLCSAEALSSLPGCLPSHGGRIYLTGCFMRYENYSFFQEHTSGQEDSFICVNKTRRNNAFEQSASKAVFQTVETAPKTKDYHAGKQVLISGTANKSAYAVANCWRTLDADSCGYCLQKAARSMLGCLPASEGYALYAGCSMQYSDSNFLYPKHNSLSKGKLIAIVVAVSCFVAFLMSSIVAFYAWKRRSKSKRRQGSDDTKLLMLVNKSILNFKYSTIEKATGSFDEANKLGQGGFGTVYKGVLSDGREIAAKRLFFNQRHRTGDFYHEVNIISSVDHKNLVKLVGFSLGSESILIYEYLSNKSLDHFIFDAVRGKELNWAKRFDIIVGIAEGLAYLHENSKTRIIHRDIKAANILLDSRLRAKIADFGLARSFQEDKNHISTGIAGTLGYMAPEYVLNGKLTEKVDVYSFGVLLLEVVTGIPNRGIQISDDTHSLLSIAWRHFKQGIVDELFDPNLMLNDDTSSSMKKEMKSVIHIGLLCTQEVPSLRPSMSMTLQMLSKNIEPLPSPSNPPYLSESDTETNEFGQIPGLRLRVNNPASLPTVTHGSLSPR